MQTFRQPLRALLARTLSLALLFVVSVSSFAAIYTYTRPSAQTRVHAATSSNLNFQGRLLQTNGALVADGGYTIEFNLYNSASGGASLWTEKYQGSAYTCPVAGSSSTGSTNAKVTVKNGYFSVSLGSLCTFPTTINWDQEHWLTMKVESDTEMTPRLKLTAVPYAFRSGQADRLTNGTSSLTSDDLLQKAPVTIQSINSALAGLRIDQTGAGGLLQLQGGGTDVFTVDKQGNLVLSGTVNTNTFNGTGLTFGGTAATTIQAANNQSLTLKSQGSGGLTLDSANGTLVLGASTSIIQKSAVAFSFDLANAGTSTFNIINSNGSNVAGLDVEGALSAGNGNAFVVNEDGDLLSSFTALNGTTTTNGTSGASPPSTSLTLTDATNFDVGNYVQVNDIGCGGAGVNTCYSKITAKVGNTLTISPALTWTTGKTVNEYHVPEIGGAGASSALANRYGRGYFISGIAAGNGTTYYNENSIESSLSSFDLLNTGVTKLNIGGGATTISLGSATTTVNIPGNLSIGGTQRLDQAGVLRNVTGDNTNGVSFNANTITSGTLTTARGGTGLNSFTANGLLYATSTSALGQANGTAGQILVANGSNVPTFTALSGDATIDSSGVLTIGADKVTLGTDTTGSYIANLGTMVGLTITGINSGEGSTPGLSVDYGSLANTAVQGNTQVTCSSGTGDLSGGGNTITLGAGGTCNSITISEAPIFNTSVSAPLLTSSGALTIQTTGTIGADDIIFATAGTEKLRLLENGQLVFGTDTNLYRSAADTLKTDDSLEVGGNWKGSTAVNDKPSEGGNATYTETRKALAYYLSSNSGSINANITTTFNITGLPSVEGSYAFIHTSAGKAATLVMHYKTTSVQINGTPVSNITSGDPQLPAASRKEAYMIMYINGSWRVMGYGSTTADGAPGGTFDTVDFAEWIPYSGDVKPQPGEVLTVGDADVSAKRSDTPYDKGLIGVVSTSPYQTAGADDGHSVIIALTGRVPVKVSLENGPIARGDYLTSSSTPGVAMKSTKPGNIIGTSLSSYNGTEPDAQVTVQLRNGYADPGGGGLVSATGQSLNLNGDVFTDLTGNGLQITAGALNIDATTNGVTAATSLNSGIEVTPDGLRLLGGCSSDQLLKWNTTAWACADDNTGVSEARLKEFAQYIDSKGNGNLNTLTVNGVLQAGTIRADHIEGLEYNGRFESLEARVNELEQRPETSTEKPAEIDLANLSVGNLTVNGTATLKNSVIFEQGASIAGDVSIAGHTKVNQMTVHLNLIAQGALEVKGPATFKEVARFEKDAQFDGQINVLGYANVQGLTVNLDLIVNGALEVKGPATFKEVARFEKDAQFDGNVAVKGQTTFNSDTAGYATIKAGETSAKIKFSKPKTGKPVISLALGDGKFAQYSYKNVTEEEFEIILAVPALEDLTFSWVAVSADQPVVLTGETP